MTEPDHDKTFLPPAERPRELLPDIIAEKYIPFHRFYFNPNYPDLPPYILFASGSFSPITILHTQIMVRIRDYIMHEHGLGNVIGGIISPVHDAYGKSSLVPCQHRFEMCRLSCLHIPWLFASEIEIQQKAWVETLLIMDQINDLFIKKFQAIGAQVKPTLVFCVGSDVFLTWSRSDWWAPRDIETFVTKYRVGVVLRENDGPKVEAMIQSMPILTQYRQNIYICEPIFVNTISSTLVRDQLHNKTSIHGLVTQDVEKYIYDNGLYGALQEPIGQPIFPLISDNTNIDTKPPIPRQQ